MVIIKYEVSSFYRKTSFQQTTKDFPSVFREELNHFHDFINPFNAKKYFEVSFQKKFT